MAKAAHTIIHARVYFKNNKNKTTQKNFTLRWPRQRTQSSNPPARRGPLTIPMMPVGVCNYHLVTWNMEEEKKTNSTHSRAHTHQDSTHIHTHIRNSQQEHTHHFQHTWRKCKLISCLILWKIAFVCTYFFIPNMALYKNVSPSTTYTSHNPKRESEQK